MKKFSILVAVLMTALCAKAVVADPTPFYETLPDGRRIQVVLHGDEFFHYTTDLQGNVVKGHIPTQADEANIHARKAAMRATASGGFPLKGSPKAIVILMQYQDLSFMRTKQNFEDLLMQSGYSYNHATGSCRDFFIACSDSIFQPQFDVYGPYMAEHNMDYYGSNDDANARELIIEACQSAHDAGVNLAQYDTDNDGILDNVFVYYAGHNEAEGGSEKTIWPHKGSVIYENVTIDGVRLANYACTSELKGASGNTQCAIGTFCHEFGHVLGLPDWYDTSSAKRYTLGNWSIMGSGNYNNDSNTPPSYNAYERFFLGWLKPSQLSKEGQYTLEPLTESNTAYLIAESAHNLVGNSPKPTEFFLLENRQQVGWDAPYLPGTGMLIWHVDYNASTWSSNTPNVKDPMGLHLVEADGCKNTSSATDPYPGIKNITSALLSTHSGTTLTNQPVYNIHTIGSNVGFTYISSGIQHLETNLDSISFVVNKDANGKSMDWKSVKVTVRGWGLEANETFTATTTSKSNFYITQEETAIDKEKSMYWSHSIKLNAPIQADSTMEASFYVCYKTSGVVCEEEAGLLTIASIYNHYNVVLNGTAPRATLVTTPIVKKATDITPYAFTAHWNAVTDAETYYFTLYQTEEGQTSFVQDFEKFNNPSQVALQGWQSSSNALTSSVKKDGNYALLLVKDGDYLITEQYNATITSINFWVNAFYADTANACELTIMATADGVKWEEVAKNTISTNAKNKTIEYTFAKSKGYNQFAIYYKDLGGAGIAFDAFTAVASEKITYIYKGAEKAIADDGRSTYDYPITGLNPLNTYYYQVQCTDGGKGCVEHITDLSNVRTVTTLAGADPDGDNLTLDINNNSLTYDDASHVIYTPSMETTIATLQIYDSNGRMIYNISVGQGQTIIYLPNDCFTAGHIYIAKYMPGDKMKRKDKWVKFIYK